ncbi:MAG: chorismate mutase [Gemmatimonadaceae bacterium]|nr:chorismate mutase [Gemmatimonadaceae bacterium]
MMRVAFQGVRGAYSESAIARIWRHPVEVVPLPDFNAVVRAVHDGEADACVIPVENSIVGRVDAGSHALAAYPDVLTFGETVVMVRHCLLASPGATVEGLRTVSSHPVALAQCGRFFGRNPWIVPTTSFDTAGAARDVSESGDLSRAAIAGRAAAERYGLAVLEEGIQDSRDNHTRFVAAVSRSSGLWRRTHAIRGATSVEEDEPRQITEATQELLRAMVYRNSIELDEVVSVIFSVTPDLKAAFPAQAAREMGWVDVPLLCVSEIPVPGSMPRCLRALVQVELSAPRRLDPHIYLRKAVSLRPDVARRREVAGSSTR